MNEILEHSLKGNLLSLSPRTYEVANDDEGAHAIQEVTRVLVVQRFPRGVIPKPLLCKVLHQTHPLVEVWDVWVGRPGGIASVFCGSIEVDFRPPNAGEGGAIVREVPALGRAAEGPRVTGKIEMGS